MRKSKYGQMGIQSIESGKKLFWYKGQGRPRGQAERTGQGRMGACLGHTTRIWRFNRGNAALSQEER